MQMFNIWLKKKVMKNLLTLLIVFSSFIAAEEYKYEPVANKAEYYSGQFNKGKDMDDLLSWGEKFVEWMEDKSAWDPMETVVFSPYFQMTCSAQIMSG